MLAAGSGGDASGLNLRWASNTFNTVNQLTARTTPGYVESYGTAHSNATVTVGAVGPSGMATGGGTR
ncbi:MAG TPA: hypothetical protein VFZ59_03350 [Verrucomicrobiae bacterium]|nr:hypothetical protein [Verrucomicrobiae bacterium]